MRPNKLKILLVEDSALDAELITLELRRKGLEFSVRRVEEQRDFLAALTEQKPDLILSDHGLPGFGGVKALRLAKELAPEIPFIFVAGAIGEELVIETFEGGADDYVLKDRLANLAPAIERVFSRSKRPEAVPQGQAFIPEPESPGLLKAAVAQAKESVVITTSQLDFPGPQIVFVNEAFARMTGYTPEEVLGKTPRILQGPKTDRTVLDRLKRQLAAGETFQGEAVNYRKDGSEFILEWEIAPVRSEDGQVTHFVSVQRDITVRKEAEAARLELERERAVREQEDIQRDVLRKTLERVADAFVALDKNWCYTYLNQKAAEIFGRKVEDLLGKHIWTEFPEGIGQPFHLAYEKAMAEQRPMQIEQFYPPYNKWFENRIYPAEDGLCIFFQDVTERHEAAEALQLERERFVLASRATKDVLYDLDLKEQRLWWSENFQSVFQYSPAEIEPGIESWDSRVHPEDRERVVSSLYAAFNSGESYWQAVYRFRRGDGTYAHVHDRGYMTRDEHGRAMRMVGAMMDISQEKTATEALAESQRRLKAMLESITDGFFALNLDWQFTYVNREAERIIQKPRAELIGRNLWQVFPELVGSAFYHQCQHALRENVSLRFEEFNCKLEVWLAIVVYPSLEGLSVYFHDVTQRRLAQEALRASEELNRSIIQSSQDCIKVLDLEGRLLSMTEHGQKMMEISDLRPYIGRLWVDVWKCEQKDAARNAFIEAQQGRIGRFQGSCATMEGSPKFWDVICSPILDVQGKPVQVLSVSRDITGWKNAEERLRLSEARKNAVLQTALDAIISIDHLGLVREWNPAAENILGYRRGEAIGREMAELIIPPEFREQHRRGLAHYLKTGEGPLIGKRFELMAMRSDGSLFPAEISITQMPGEGMPFFTGYVRDITRRKTAEEKQKQLNDQMRASAEMLDLAQVFVRDMARRIIAWHGGAAQLYGYSKAEAVGQKANELLKTEFPIPLAQIEAEVISQGEWLGELTHVRKDGNKIVVATRWVLHRDADGHPAAILEGDNDITARKVAERKALEREERLRWILESAREYAIITTDLGGRITGWNSGAESIFGYSQDEVLGTQLGILYTSEDQAHGQERAEVHRALSQGMAENERWHVRKTGERFWGSGSLRPLQDEMGKATGFLKILQDHTSRRRMEQEIRLRMRQLEEAQTEIQDLNRDLEERVRRRTAELEEANRELEAFSYSVSHDLRAPLRHILGYINLLQTSAARKLDEEERRFLGTVEGAARRMGELIDHLLDFARMLRVGIHKRTFPIRSLFEEAIQMLEEQRRGREIEWRFLDLPLVHGDPSLLQQVVVNLLSNAVKYTAPRERARIEMGGFETPQEVTIFVRDNGVGFDMAHAERLFGVFQRLHSQSEFEGSGIGLANVRRIVQRHGGRVWAEGRLGRGATFYFALPKPGAPRTG